MQSTIEFLSTLLSVLSGFFSIGVWLFYGFRGRTKLMDIATLVSVISMITSIMLFST